MTANRKMCTIVGSNKGGVGKSMISLMQAMIYDNAKYPLSIIEIDNEKKLSALLGDRVNLSLEPFVKISDSTRNRHAAESHYNRAYNLMAKSDSLLDFGANVTTPFFEWFEQSEMGHFSSEDNIFYRFVACASPDEQAISAAISSIETAKKSLGPTAEYYVVLNDINGQSGFTPYEDNPEYLKVLEMDKKGEIQIVRVNYCDSLIFEHGKAMKMTPVEIVQKSNEVSEHAGLDTITARVHVRKLMTWLMDTQNAMSPILQVYDFEPGKTV